MGLFQIDYKNLEGFQTCPSRLGVEPGMVFWVMALIWRDLRIFLRGSWARNSPTQRISSTEYPAISSESKIKIWEQVDSKRKWIRYQLGTGITLTLKLDFVGHHWTISAWPVSWSWSFEAKGSPLEEPKHALWDTAVGESHSQIQKTRSANLQICQLFNPKSHLANHLANHLVRFA